MSHGSHRGSGGAASATSAVAASSPGGEAVNRSINNQIGSSWFCLSGVGNGEEEEDVTTIGLQ